MYQGANIVSAPMTKAEILAASLFRPGTSLMLIAYFLECFRQQMAFRSPLRQRRKRCRADQ